MPRNCTHCWCTHNVENREDIISHGPFRKGGALVLRESKPADVWICCMCGIEQVRFINA